PAQRSFGGRVPGGAHPRRRRGRTLPRPHFHRRRRGRGAGAAGGAALRRARRGPARGRVPSTRKFRAELPAPARRACARGRRGLPRAGAAGPGRGSRRDREDQPRAHRRRAAGAVSPVTTSPYRPPRWLRSAHLQSVLAGSPLRRRRGLAALAASGALTREVVVDGGGDVRLLGLHTALPGVEPRGMALLLHGWEGSAESAYVCLAAAGFL